MDDKPSFTISDGRLFIKGCDENEIISIYSIDGKKLFQSRIDNGGISYSFLKGTIYIIKIGKNGFKIAY